MSKNKEGAALAAPASAASAAKGKFKFAESRRFIKKKFEPTFSEARRVARFAKSRRANMIL